MKQYVNVKDSLRKVVVIALNTSGAKSLIIEELRGTVPWIVMTTLRRESLNKMRRRGKRDNVKIGPNVLNSNWTCIMSGFERVTVLNI